MQINQFGCPDLIVFALFVLQMGNLVQHRLLVVARAECHPLVIKIRHAAVVRQLGVFVPVDVHMVEIQLVFTQDAVEKEDRFLPCGENAWRHAFLHAQREGETFEPSGFCHGG